MIKKCVFKVKHFFNLSFCSFFILFSSESAAHTIILSEYRLECKDDEWILSFQQKTSHLRDAIYAERPDLKGINLNADVFLEETSKYIAANLTLKYHGKLLKMTPKLMRYGGLKFESQFFIKGLPKRPDYLTIVTSGFDAHEHSMKLLSITIEDQGYINYFNKDQNLATFSFDSKQYLFSEVKISRGYDFLIYIAGALLLLGLTVTLLSKKSKILRPKSS